MRDDDPGLTDEVHIITGAGSGFGRSSAVRFARDGARVVCADIDADAAERTVDEIRTAGGDAVAVAADVADPAAVDALAARTLEAYGRIDGLFANAGVPGAGSIDGLSVEEWQRTLAVNLTGPMLCARAVVPAMREAGRGAILMTASISGLRAFPNQAAYAATKGGVIALARQLALDLAPSGIRVNSIAPGLVRTAVVEGIYRRREAETGVPWEDALAGMQARYPLGLGRLDDVTSAAAYLQSPAARWITGTNLTVDGGFTA